MDSQPPLDLDDVHRMLGAYVVQLYQLRKALQEAQQKLAEKEPTPPTPTPE